MTHKITTYDILNSFAILFILSNANLYLGAIPILQTIVSGLRALAVGYAFLIALPKLRFGKYTILVCAFYFIAGLLTIAHDGSMHAWAANAVNSIGLVLLVYLSMLRSPKYTIGTLAFILDLFIYANFIFTLIYPDGIGEEFYLLGVNRNSPGPVIICGMVVHYYAYKQGIRNKLTFLLLGAISIATPIIIGSMTSAVGCSLMTLFFFISSKKIRKIALISLFVFYLTFQAFLVFFQNDISVNKYATFFVEEVMQKDLSFTNRTYVWSDSYKLIRQSPITGYGMQDSEWFEEQLMVKSAHNIIYQIMIYGGYILFTMFLIVIYASIKRTIKNYSNLTLYSLFGVCAFFFMMIMEAYSMSLIFLILCLTYYSPEFSTEQEETK